MSCSLFLAPQSTPVGTVTATADRVWYPSVDCCTLEIPIKKGGPGPPFLCDFVTL